MLLSIRLGDTEVAQLERRDDGRVEFAFRPSYLERRHRPVLSLFYLDKLLRTQPAGDRLPAFFANLLPEPEGPLFRLITQSAGIREHQEMRLLAHLGEDLPGNVIVQLIDDSVDLARPPELGAALRQDAQKLRFSLAGVQLKFSMMRTDKGLTLPASGRGGDWIVKLPDLKFAGVPENEYAVMSWAGESGIDVPEFEVVTAAELEGIPDQRFFPGNELCFAIRRFDRPLGGRVHIEDFAQVNALYPRDKYDEDRSVQVRINYETLANQILTFCGEADLRQFIRRLIFTVLSGNADAHLKNWSLIYPDGRTPRLSPAYDQVATIAYTETSDELALPFHGSRSFEAVSLAGFRRLAAKLRRDPDEIAKWVGEDLARIMDAWSAHAATLPFSLEARFALDQHHKRLRAAGTLLK